MPLTLQTFNSPQPFLQALLPYADEVDTPSMNTVFGAAGDSARKAVTGRNGLWMLLYGEQMEDLSIIIRSQDEEPSVRSPIRLAICSHNLETFYVATPRQDPELLTIASQVVGAIVNALDSAGIAVVNSVFGPKHWADPFLAAWGARSNPPLSIREKAFLTTRAAYITKEDLGPTPSESITPELRVTELLKWKQGRNAEEVAEVTNQLGRCMMEFLGSLGAEGTAMTRSLIRTVLDEDSAGRLWICHSFQAVDESSGPADTKVAGFLYTGRETNNTIAIRMVFTKEAFRGKGVACALVSKASRWWLSEGEKSTVVLFVEPQNVPATRAYIRAGFKIQEEIWERRGFNGLEMGSF